jgi:hypothetical protein
MRLKPGDKVCINQHAFENDDTRNTLVAATGCLATVLSYDEYSDHIHHSCASFPDFCVGHLSWIKRGMDNGTFYPIQFDTVVPPPEEFGAHWRETRGGLCVKYEVGGIDTLHIDFLTLLEPHSSIIESGGFLARDLWLTALAQIKVTQRSSDIKWKYFPRILFLGKGIKAPCECAHTFSTVSNNQTDIPITIYSGVKDFLDSANIIGRYTIGNLPPALAGVPQVVITFNVLTSGDIIVEAINGKTNDMLTVDKEFEIKDHLDKS